MEAVLNTGINPFQQALVSGNDPGPLCARRATTAAAWI